TTDSPPRAGAKAGGKESKPKDLPSAGIRLDGGKVRSQAFEKAGQSDAPAGTVARDTNPTGDKPPRPRPHPDARAGQFDSQTTSPDGKWEASIDLTFNVSIRNRDTDNSTSLSSDGTERDPYLAEFYWSPDSSRLVVIRD